MLNASKMFQSRLRGSDILRLPVSSLSSNSMFYRLPLLPQNVSTPALNPYPQLGWSSNRLGKSPVSHLLPLFGVTSFHILGQVARHHQRKRKRVSRWHERWLRKCSAERLSVVETVSLYTLQRLPAEGQKGRFCCEPASTWTACGRWYRSFGPSHTFTMVQINIMAIWWNHCGGQHLIGSLVYYTMNIIYYICGHDIMCIYMYIYIRTVNDTAGSGGIHQNRKADPVSSKWIQMLKWPRQMKIRIVDALHHQITQRPFGHTQGSMVVQRPRSTALPSSNRLNHKGTQRCKWLSHHKLTGGGNITSRHSCTRNHTYR